jgi:serine/threonine protein kinase
MKEVDIMEGIQSEHVVQYHASFIVKQNIWIVMDYCAAGSASDIMKIRNCCFTESEIQLFCRDILFGLRYLHSRSKIHRDIKSG